MMRWMAGLAVAGVVLGLLASPARAADDGLDVYLGNLTVAAGSAGKVTSPLLFTATQTAVEDLKIIVDFSGLAGVAAISAYAPGSLTCTSGASLLTCTSSDSVSVDAVGLGILPLLVEPASAAALGAGGTMAITVSARGFTAVTRKATVTIGEGVDLSARDAIRTSAPVGGQVPLPLTVTNKGATAVRGVVLWLSPEYALRVGKQYSNCRYPAGWLLVVCQFDTTLEPGQTYALASPLPFTIGADTPAPGTVGAAGQWLTPAEWADFEGLLRNRGVPVGATGTAGALSLAPVTVSSALADPPQADVEPSNNGVSVEVAVKGSNKTDLAAVGASVRGGLGASVVTRVGVSNLGPALADGKGSSITPARVTLPPHATAVRVPAGCAARSGSSREYACETTAWLPVGATYALEFTLRVDRVIPNATGRIEINDGANVETAAKRTNDAASIVLNASSGSGSGGSGGGSGSGETLPITGTNLALVAGVGTVLVALGVLALLATRRRGASAHKIRSSSHILPGRRPADRAGDENLT
jgi:hypothetical protein